MVVVALGHRLTSETIHPHLAGRVDVAIDLFRSSDADRLVFTGGATSPGIPIAECEVMRSYAVDRGVTRERIYVDDRAQDTIGNAYFTRRLLDGLEGGVDEVCVVTADYHAERAKYAFERCFDASVTIDASHTLKTSALDEQVHEAVALERTRSFFDGIERGDVAAIGRRLHEAHDLYELPTETIERP